MVAGHVLPSFDMLRMLLETDPRAYRCMIARMSREELSAFVEYMRAEIERTNEQEDRPLTENEVDDMIDHTAAALGWSRRRVMSEGVLRLRAAALHGEGGPFKPVTPPDDPGARKGCYQRRHSSIRALVLGEYRAVKAAKATPEEEPPKSSPGIYRGREID